MKNHILATTLLIITLLCAPANATIVNYTFEGELYPFGGAAREPPPTGPSGNVPSVVPFPGNLSLDDSVLPIGGYFPPLNLR